MATYTMHVYGEMCPAPLVKGERKLREMQPGDSRLNGSEAGVS